MAQQLSRPLQLASWALVMCSLVSLAAAAALERPQAAAGHSSRIAVMFDEEHKLQIKQQLLDKGYSILTEGSGFFAVGTPAAARSRPTTAASPAAAAAAATTGRRLTQQGKLKERQQQQQQQQRHVQHIERMSGVISSEPDVRRFLHMRPSFLGGQQQPPGQHTAAAAAAAGRRLATTAATAAGSGSSRAQSPRASVGHLSGHWHQGSSFRPGPYDIWGKDISDPRCAALDTPLSEGPGGEVVPWGIKKIGAWNDTLQALPAKGRAIVCIIDSGLWKQHPEYASSSTTGTTSSSGAKVDTIDGCKTSVDCPFTWSEDVVGHGTHVAGTIAAPRNGLGVVGVMYGGAELHVVRIWNESGDVSQGQGPYATDLVLAYDNCLNHLKAEQAKSSSSSGGGGGKGKINMVINMSYGSAGPLTVERLWVQRAAARGDVLFVASAGNNGSFLLDPALFGSLDQGPGKPRLDPGQSLSYPASYNLPEVLSVANARCDDTIDFTSQKNKAVSIAAPGMAILSSVPKQYGAVRAAVATSSALPNQTAPAFSSTGGQQASQGAYSLPPFGSGGRAAPGRGPGPAIVRKGIGYLSNGYLEPRPVQGTQLGSTGMRPLVACNITGDVRAAAFSRSGQPSPGEGEACPGAAGAVCLIELPGSIDWYMETCLAMLKCTRSGGKGLMLWRSDKLLSGLFSDPDPLDSEAYEPDETLLGTQINCGTKCGCWPLLKQQLRCEDGDCASKAPPAIVVSAKHAAAMLNASKLAAAAAARAPKAGDKSKSPGASSSSGPFMVNVTNYQYNYRHFDGTSMAAPHVSGAAALLWRLAPNCKARDVAEALKQSAAKLAKQPTPPSGPDLAAGSGLVRVDRAVDWIMQNKDCAKS